MTLRSNVHIPAIQIKLPGNVLNGPFGEVIATGIVPRVAAS